MIWSILGCLFICLGIYSFFAKKAMGFPLLSEQGSAWILLSVAGVMVESITAMVVYTIVIEKKYKKK